MVAEALSKITKISIRSRLFRDLVLVILFTLGLLVLVSWLLIGALKRELAEAHLAEAAQLVRDEVQGLLRPVEQQLLIARDRLMAEDTRPTEVQALGKSFLPTLRHIPQIAGAIFADAEGREYFLVREGDNWRLRLSAPPETATWKLLNGAGEELEARPDPQQYDPRQRPWYRLAEAAAGAAEANWSAPYVFHTLKVPGVSASLAWESATGLRVLAFDVVLERLLEAISHLPLGTEGQGFLFSADGGVFTPGAGDEHEPGWSRRRFFSAEEQLGGPLFIDAVAAWKSAGKPDTGLLTFDSGGQTWWGGFLPLSRQARSAWVGVVLPTSATRDLLPSRWPVLALNVLVIVGLGIGLAALLMRKYSRQLRDLPKLTIEARNAEADLRTLIAQGEDVHLEFKSTMRTNLHTHKPGKEIELAWLKGAAAFMNTEGGIVLLGVADDGAILGLEADGFENDDRCRLHFKNLLNQHLGAEYARHLRFALYRLEGRQIAAVECERADAPVFLRHKNTEAFLIRSGPANLELSLSRALHYIRGRF